MWKLVAFQILTAFLASGASIPTSIPSTSIISDTAADVNNTSNHSLTVQPSCMVLPGRYVNITIQSCQPALNQLMLQPGSSRRVEYQWDGQAIQLTRAPCIISLDCTEPCPDLLIASRQIVGYAYWTIANCEFAAMGWMQIEGARTWLVTVTGAAMGSAVENSTIGETGNATLDEDQGERYNGLIESS